MDEVDDFPYRAEYAKSSRSSCRSCKSNIGKGNLRLAAMVQSPAFDGKIPQWYHYMCFFSKQRPKAAQDIAHFDSLRWDDQRKIEEKIAKGGSTPISATGSKKKSANKSNTNFSIEYAKSGRAVCKGCEEKILKDVIRVSALDFDSEKARRFGPIPQWHHVDCFVVLLKELNFFDGGANLNGFNTLSADDKKIIREKIKPIQRNAADVKAADVTDSSSKASTSKIKNDIFKKQNTQMFQYRDLLEKNLNKSELSTLLECNDYDPLTGESRMLDTLADLMTFGKIDRCAACTVGNLIFKSGVGYVCSGSITEWTKCTSVNDSPKRSTFQVPKELREEYPFLKKYKYKNNGDRALIKRTVSSEGQGVKRKEMEKSKPLEDLTFVIVGTKFVKSKKEIKEKILLLGGEISSTIVATTAAVITTKDYVDAINKKLMPSKEHGVECVPEEFLDEIEPEGVLLMIKKKNMAPWAKDVEQRLSNMKKIKSNFKSKLKKDSKYELNQEKMKITLKGGGYIDPKSGLADSCHVYKAGEKLYSVVLGMVDLSKGINSYYKLQVIESDDKRSWNLYRSWGRIGTTVGDYRVEDKLDLQDALRDFNDLYEKKTGNKFKSKEQQKLAGYWFPLDIDHGEESSEKLQLNVKKSKSKLAKQIQELVALLFDVKSMENTMVEYELDLKKMPLGKLSQKQVENAYKVLSEAMDWIEKLKKDADEKLEAAAELEQNISTINNHLLDCSNRFYTLIPHDFGMKNPPLLDNEDYIKNKIDMVASLKEIEIAYNLLKSDDGGKAADPIDQCYKKLETNFVVLDKTSEEFKMIKTYVKNTHASTHLHYTLELEEVFKVARHGEEKRFKPFKKLHNRHLLWHGSRLTNFVGILSQGLRIAPPEAPSTGYMFGKGVYFADMVSKSANYCCTSPSNATGLLLLCDVALGDMYELKSAKYITKLPSGKHSTKGVGKTHPDPSQTIKLEDGLQVPLGKSKEADVKNSTLLYNEYIVYDTAQINVKYLLKTTFKYKY